MYRGGFPAEAMAVVTDLWSSHPVGRFSGGRGPWSFHLFIVGGSFLEVSGFLRIQFIYLLAFSVVVSGAIADMSKEVQMVIRFALSL